MPGILATKQHRVNVHASGLVLLLAGFSACASAGTMDASTADTTSSSEAAAAETSVSDDASMPDASSSDIGATPEAGAVSLRGCPGSMAGCFALTPIETGLSATGANANVEHLALRPMTGTPRGVLLLFFNGSGGSPRGAAASLTVNWYTAARSVGLHVLALSYRSDDTVGGLCARAADRDGCFVPTRQTILTGRFQTGAASALSSIQLDEGAYPRIAAALRTLAAGDPSGGWENFLDRTQMSDPERAIRWSSVMVSGHSQGGGHAALVAKNHAVQRVLVLSSPCDTTATGPASWLRNDGSFATNPTTAFFGLGATGDTICPGFEAIWNALGMPASARNTSAVVCASSTPHGASVACVENASTWAMMLR